VAALREHSAICALQNRDTPFGAKPHNETADGAGKSHFKRVPGIFSDALIPVEIRRYNH
jgi:hypothetical protein